MFTCNVEVLDRSKGWVKAHEVQLVSSAILLATAECVTKLYPNRDVRLVHTDSGVVLFNQNPKYH